MKRITFLRLLIFVFITALFISLGILKLKQDSRKSRLDEDVFVQYLFRRQSVSEEMMNFIKDQNKPGEYLGLFWLETNFNEMKFPCSLKKQTFRNLKMKWSKLDYYGEFIERCSSIWNDVKYFPVAELKNKGNVIQPFVDSWMFERTYGGKRGHEGTDILAIDNKAGRYPIISMTDGTVVNKGWLEQGGYRLGILTDSNVYFYYAHLDSYADLNVGDQVKAGDFLGYMGDSGYGVEGTKGKFPVHLHLGIYIFHEGQEISVNPYSVLRYIEPFKVKCSD